MPSRLLSCGMAFALVIGAGCTVAQPDEDEQPTTVVSTSSPEPIDVSTSVAPDSDPTTVVGRIVSVERSEGFQLIEGPGGMNAGPAVLRTESGSELVVPRALPMGLGCKLLSFPLIQDVVPCYFIALIDATP